MSSSEYAGDEQLLVPGKLIGYRLFAVKGIRLVAMGVGYCWHPGENSAQCMRQLWYGNPHHSDKIQESCTCGFYARYEAYDLNDLIELGYPLGTSGFVYGVIEAYGQVFLGSRGFRTEKARILAISRTELSYPYQYCLSHNLVNEIAYEYGVDHQYDLRSMARKYPQQDLRSLVPGYYRDWYFANDLYNESSPKIEKTPPYLIDKLEKRKQTPYYIEYERRKIPPKFLKY